MFKSGCKGCAFVDDTADGLGDMCTQVDCSGAIFVEEPDTKIYEEALDVWGPGAQADQCQEELAELITELSHWKRVKTHGVEEEIADVEIMLAQMRLSFDTEKVDRIKKEKLERLRKLLDGHSKNKV